MSTQTFNVVPQWSPQFYSVGCTTQRSQIWVSFMLGSLNWWQIYLWETPVFAFCIQSPAWLLSDSAVPHCVPGCPPVSQCLDHSGPVCQIVDICLLPPPSVAMAAKKKKPHHHGQTPPLAGRPAFSTPLSCFPPDTSCEPLMLILQSTSYRLVTSTASTALFLKLSLYYTLLCDTLKPGL